MSEFNSRMEQYLKNCIEKCGCDGLPAPRSRAEVLLYQLAEELAGGAAFGEQDVVLFPATDLEMIDGAAMDMAGVWLAEGEFGNFENGKTYTVVFNGTPYTVTAIDIDGEGNTLLGNLVFYGGDDTGEPFMITKNVLVCADQTVNLTVKGKQTKPLDYKYLPSIPEIDLTPFGVITKGVPNPLPHDIRADFEKAALRGMCIVCVNGLDCENVEYTTSSAQIMFTARDRGGVCTLESTFDEGTAIFYAKLTYQYKNNTLYNVCYRLLKK